MRDPLSEKRIRVLIVEDSPFFQQILQDALFPVDGLEIIGCAGDGAQGIMQVMSHHPDVITLDLGMPRVDGFVFLRWLMKHAPTPVLVVSSQCDQASVFKALELGAVDFLAKPDSQASSDTAQLREQLISKLITISLIPRKRLAFKSLPPSVHGGREFLSRRNKRGDSKDIQIVAIGASTGGPTAIQSLLVHLPKGFPVPVTVAQHMPPGFTQHFAERLNKLSRLPVREARQGDLLRKGTVYICPGGDHMTFEKAHDGIHIKLVQRGLSDKYVPSVDRMFSSACDIFSGKVLGVILTGMGYDGKIGMREIKNRGGQTIAESEETAVVFGMPREAIEEGIVDQVLPLSMICAEIVRSVRRSSS